MNGNRFYGVRVEGAKYGVGFGSALAIAISYTTNHSILWAIIHGILGWLYVIYFALFRSCIKGGFVPPFFMSLSMSSFKVNQIKARLRCA
ncbi:hypothetical protein [Bradyrhizobium sp.]|jgi:hypothetical protein|uniref:hypothetical protein n=2 Tax=Bradyrhizobium sp. TaxID=376 RepID=UPI003C4A38FD